MKALDSLLNATALLHHAVRHGGQPNIPAQEVPTLLLAYCIGFQQMTLPDAYMLGRLHLPGFLPSAADLQRIVDAFQLPYHAQVVQDAYFPQTLLMASMRGLQRVHEGIYLSGINAIQQPEQVARMGVQAVLRLDCEAEQWREDFTVLHLATPDRAPLPDAVIAEGVAFLRTQVAQGKGVLVHCHAGISRSTALVLAYLLEAANMSLPDAYQQVLLRRPVIAPHRRLLESLVSYYRLPVATLQAIQPPRFVQLLQQAQVPEPLPDWAADTRPHQPIVL